MKKKGRTGGGKGACAGKEQTTGGERGGGEKKEKKKGIVEPPKNGKGEMRKKLHPPAQLEGGGGGEKTHNLRERRKGKKGEKSMPVLRRILSHCHPEGGEKKKKRTVNAPRAGKGEEGRTTDVLSALRQERHFAISPWREEEGGGEEKISDTYSACLVDRERERGGVPGPKSEYRRLHLDPEEKVAEARVLDRNGRKERKKKGKSFRRRWALEGGKKKKRCSVFRKGRCNFKI